MEKHQKSILFMIGQCFTFTAMMTLGKFIIKLNPFLLVFSYYFVALILTSSYLLIFRKSLKILKSSMLLHFIRAILNVIAYISYFRGLKDVNLGAATSITFMLPIFAVILGSIILKEKITKAKLISLFLSVVGVLLILRPGADDFKTSSLWILIATISWAGVDLLTKFISTRSDTIVTQTFYATLFPCLTLIPFIISDISGLNALDYNDMIIVLLLSISLIFQIILLFKALKNGEFSTLMQFDYLRLPISVLAGYLIFSEVISPYSIIGSVIIIFAGINIMHHEKKINRKDWIGQS